MSFRLYLVLMALATIISGTTWLLILWNMSPATAGIVGLFLFYITLFTTLIGLVTCLGTVVRFFLFRTQDAVSRQVRIAFRHALFLSLVAVISLLFSAQGWMHWWLFILFIVFAGGGETLFLLKEQSRRR